MQHKMCRLVSGEIIIGSVEEIKEGATVIEIDTPMVVHFAPAPNGQLGINLFPLNPFTGSKNEIVPLKVDHIMFWMSEVHDDIQKQYVEIVSGITVPEKEGVEIPEISNIEIVG